MTRQWLRSLLKERYMPWSLLFIHVLTLQADNVTLITEDKKTELSSYLCLGINKFYYSFETKILHSLSVRHMHFVGSRACYRTALEICKVLLTLDPSSDPLAIVLLIDFYALRSRCNKWLVDLYTAWNPSRNLSQLPNFSYSTALASFHLSQEASGAEASALLISADSLLQEALLSFPSVLLPLLDKCSIEPHKSVVSLTVFKD